MPKKIHSWGNYYVTAPGIDLSVIDFLNSLPKGRWVGDSELSGNNEKLKDELFNAAYFLDCSKYFREINPIQKPFKVIKRDYFFHGTRLIDGMEMGICLIWDEEDIANIQQALDEQMPFKWHSRNYLFGINLWEISKSETFLSPDELRSLFLEAVDRGRKKFERLKNKFSGLAGHHIERKREPIAEEIRIFVWRRDNGRCVRCGSQENLEFDHIIPIIKGGSNTARNIQILCEKCNREKNANI